MKGHIRCSQCEKAMTLPECPYCGNSHSYIYLYWNKKDYKFRKYQQDGEPLDFNRAGLQLAEIRSKIKGKTFDPLEYLDSSIPERNFRLKMSEWLDEKAEEAQAGELSPSTVVRYEKYDRNYYDPFFGKCDVKAITDEILQQFSDSLRKKLALKTRKETVNTLHVFFKWLFRKKVIKGIPIFPVIKGDDSRTITIPEDGEFETCFNKLPEHLKDPIEFMQETGLRPGENCAIFITDISLTRREAVIQRTYSLHILNETTKGRHKDYIPLSDRAVEIARKHMSGKVGRMPLFINPNTGRGYRPKTLQNAWKKTGSKQALKDATRHVYCTRIVESGASPMEAMALMRHKDIRSTMVYFHAHTEKLRDFVNRKGRRDSSGRSSEAGKSQKRQ